MSALQWVFLVTALITVSAAVMMVASRRMMHAALWLAVALLGVAVVFVTLEASFFAVVQLLVYIGSILIIIVFAIMLTQRSTEAGPRLNPFAWGAAGVAGVVWAALTYIFIRWLMSGTPLQELGASFDDVVPLGKALVDAEGFAVPFEVASVLLLAALIGAVYIAFERRGEGS
ncbi:NADH-quinone oxidoreductase subunit J [uncultured Thermanaerothrix sp.]|uniref:NADH-quinone oxidoreductase subunit J family protein n=1 Tax=uncultured Thermanaerothrix sp. TaxID=1195149 RepID=UPI00261806C8|nr:NADH-quinone oxidoreductase subunit J [uncultured Thermanaerothrix sp.]